ncbi:MAG TPA: lysylphosphatidylglycerol synthase transmembrane domain-containing protein [Fimbriimonas sp.]|nr:lysylphosphatidylglycerol synthase transmembrane domain-containing protein [Fimbriimonas sp.]
MPKKGRGWVRPTVAAIATVCLAFAVRSAVVQLHGKVLSSPAMLAVALALFLGHYALQAVGWHLILRSLGISVKFADSASLWYSSLMARWIPGPFLYTAARLYLAADKELPVTKVAYAIVLELVYVFAGACMVTVTLAGGLIGHALRVSGSLASLIGCAVCILGVTARPNFLRDALHSKGARKLINKIAGRELSAELLPTLSAKTNALMLLGYAGFWVYSGVMFAVIARATTPITSSQAIACIPAFSGSWIAGFLAIFAPAGLGVREGVMWVMLAPSVPNAQAVVLSVFTRVLMLCAEVLSVVAAYFLFGANRKSRVSTLLPEHALVPVSITPNPVSEPQSRDSERARSELTLKV